MKPTYSIAITVSAIGAAAIVASPAKVAAAEYCMETEASDYVCLHHVRGEKQTPHINHIFVSVNGGEIENYSINCFDPGDLGGEGSLHRYVCENYTEWR